MSDSGQTIPSTWERRADAFVAALQRNAMDNPEWVLAQLLENAFNEGREYAKRYDDVAPPLTAGPVAPPPDLQRIGEHLQQLALHLMQHPVPHTAKAVAEQVDTVARSLIKFGEAPRGAAPQRQEPPTS